MANFYAMSYQMVMALPLKAFWLMNRNIDRVRAQGDLRQMSIAQFAQATPESATTFRTALVAETGTMVKLQGEKEAQSPLDAERDESGFASLRVMAGQKIGQ